MRIGPYEVLLELGRGGMGTVYLGRLVGAGGFERLVAIKRAHASALAQQDTAERFLREARLAASIHHANVVGIHQVGEDQDGQYLACDYVEGEALDRLIERDGRAEPLPIAVALRIVLDALAGLHAAHETVDSAGRPLGMLHRDVSIENLLVGRDGVTRLTDFGIAKSSVGPRLTEAGIIHGKLMYLTPECLHGATGQRSDDTYAMGVTLWIALAGAFPYRSRDNTALLNEVLNQPIPKLASVGVALGPLLEACVARALSRDPALRFQTARQMLDALDEVSARETPAARHLEVADFVERVAGRRLAQRRAKIHARRSAGEAGQAPPAPPPSGMTPIVDTLQHAAQAQATKQKQLGMWFLGAVLLASASSALWFSTRAPNGGAANGGAASTPARPAGSERDPTPISAPSASAPGTPKAGRTPEVTPLASDASAEKLGITRDAGAPKSLRARGERRPLTRPLPATDDKAQPAKAAPPALDITTDNPYR